MSMSGGAGGTGGQRQSKHLEIVNAMGLLRREINALTALKNEINGEAGNLGAVKTASPSDPEPPQPSLNLVLSTTSQELMEMAEAVRYNVEEIKVSIF